MARPLLSMYIIRLLSHNSTRIIRAVERAENKPRILIKNTCFRSCLIYWVSWQQTLNRNLARMWAEYLFLECCRDIESWYTRNLSSCCQANVVSPWDTNCIWKDKKDRRNSLSMQKEDRIHISFHLWHGVSHTATWNCSISYLSFTTP
jgi:hypothetical protein